MSSPPGGRLARLLWRRVHPDLLIARWPEAARANERSMQNLRALLDQAALPPEQRPTQPPPPQDLSFFIIQQPDAQRQTSPPPPPQQQQEEQPLSQGVTPTQGSAAGEDSTVSPMHGESLRRITARWRPPPPATRTTARDDADDADSWRRATEGCIASLLRDIEPREWTSPLKDGTTRGGVVNAADGDKDDGDVQSLIRTALAAAERQRHRQSQPEEAAERRRGHQWPRRSGGGGGTLRTELLFFHGVPETERAAATARLSGLVAQILGPGERHAPILVCGDASSATAARATARARPLPPPHPR